MTSFQCRHRCYVTKNVITLTSQDFSILNPFQSKFLAAPVFSSPPSAAVDAIYYLTLFDRILNHNMGLFDKVKWFVQLLIQVDVIIALGGFSAALLEPIKNEYVLKVSRNS